MRLSSFQFEDASCDRCGTSEEKETRPIVLVAKNSQQRSKMMVGRRERERAQWNLGTLFFSLSSRSIDCDSHAYSHHVDIEPA